LKDIAAVILETDCSFEMDPRFEIPLNFKARIISRMLALTVLEALLFLNDLCSYELIPGHVGPKEPIVFHFGESTRGLSSDSYQGKINLPDLSLILSLFASNSIPDLLFSSFSLVSSLTICYPSMH
jgi:hypothetical protein